MDKETITRLLNDYLYEKYDAFDERAWPARLKEYDNNSIKLINRIFYELDCTRKMPDGITPIISTNSLVYRRTISEALFVIDFIEECDDFYDKLFDIHNANLNYEKDCPPPVYKNKKSKAPKASKPKGEKIATPKKESLKIAPDLLKFNIKFVK